MPGQKVGAAPTMEEQRRRVALLVADGMPRREIAVVMGLKEEHLQAMFSRELEHGKALTRAESLLRLHNMGLEGKVAAERVIVDITSRRDFISQGLLNRALQGKVDPLALFSEPERDAFRRRLISIWSGLGVTLDEMGARLGISPERVITHYGLDLAIGKKDWRDPGKLVEMNRRAQSGDVDAAFTLVLLTTPSEAVTRRFLAA